MRALPFSLVFLLGAGCFDVTNPWIPTDLVDPNSSVGNVAPSPSAPTTGPWRLIFSDEFQENRLNQYRWHPSYPWGGTKGAELQEYVSSGVTIADGALHLTARRGPTQWRKYSSGMVATWGILNVTRGSVVEARVRTVGGVGLWPAIWLHASSGGWPPEIDVLEVRGFDPTNWLFAAHWSDAGVHNSRGFSENDRGLGTGWHTITMVWKDTAVMWFVDGQCRGIVTDPKEIPDEPMYLILNLAIGGGGWPGKPDSTTTFPTSFDIDYVRVWKKSMRIRWITDRLTNRYRSDSPISRCQ